MIKIKNWMRASLHIENSRMIIIYENRVDHDLFSEHSIFNILTSYFFFFFLLVLNEV